MEKHLVKWRPVKAKCIRGSDIYLKTASIIEGRYKGTLISHILAMTIQKPISFEEAARLLEDKLTEAFDLRQFGDEPGQCGWYYQNFVSWISSLGYHIELTGDEFESFALSDKLA